jgi:hypothetical protein
MRKCVCYGVAHLLLYLLASTLLAFGSGSGTLAFDTTGASIAVWGGEGEVDGFLGIKSDGEGGNVDDLLANA